MLKQLFYIVFFFCAISSKVSAQEDFNRLPDKIQRATIINGDTIPCVRLREVWIYAPYKFKNSKEEEYYWRTVRDVKKTLPFAKLIYATLMETYEFLEVLPNDKARQKHLKQMEKELFETYKPVLKKMTFRQGKLLIKLVDRECNQSSFNLIKAFLGGFRANFWNTFASMFGASLKAEWEPESKDKMLEHICKQVEAGNI